MVKLVVLSLDVTLILTPTAAEDRVHNYKGEF